MEVLERDLIASRCASDEAYDLFVSGLYGAIVILSYAEYIELKHKKDPQ